LQLLLATSNRHKIAELRRLLQGSGLEPTGLPDLHLPALHVVEDGATFAHNAAKKAQAYADTYLVAALADDSGISVDALAGAPGIKSARFGRPHFDDSARTAYLLHCLASIPQGRRCAHYTCALVLAQPGHPLLTAWGYCYGAIALAAVPGPTGFGYDPVFIPAGLDRTVSQLTVEQKDRLGHRGKAARALVQQYRAEGRQSGTLRV
jgi:XTP/dITP diphosphohydrolase